MGYGKMKKGKNVAKRSTYNGPVKSILGSTATTKGPGFMSETKPHGNISNIAGHKSIGG